MNDGKRAVNYCKPGPGTGLPFDVTMRSIPEHSLKSDTAQYFSPPTLDFRVPGCTGSG